MPDPVPAPPIDRDALIAMERQITNPDGSPIPYGQLSPQQRQVYEYLGSVFAGFGEGTTTRTPSMYGAVDHNRDINTQDIRSALGMTAVVPQPQSLPDQIRRFFASGGR